MVGPEGTEPGDPVPPVVPVPGDPVPPVVPVPVPEPGDPAEERTVVNIGGWDGWKSGGGWSFVYFGFGVTMVGRSASLFPCFCLAFSAESQSACCAPPDSCKDE